MFGIGTVPPMVRRDLSIDERHSLMLQSVLHIPASCCNGYSEQLLPDSGEEDDVVITSPDSTFQLILETHAQRFWRGNVHSGVNGCTWTRSTTIYTNYVTFLLA